MSDVDLAQSQEKKEKKMKKFASREAYLNHWIQATRDAGRYVSWQYVRGEPVPTGNIVQFVPAIKANPKKIPMSLKVEIMGKGKREGVFLVWQDETNELRFGWSLRNPITEPNAFDKTEGLYKALKRSKGIFDEDMSDNPLPIRYQRQWEHFLQNAPRELGYWEQKLMGKIVAGNPVGVQEAT